MDKAAAHVFVEGRVQGVFYRAFTRNIALRNNLTGWVKNLVDGRVEILFEGINTNIQAAIEDCKKGPPSSVVNNLHVVWENFTGNYASFEVKY